MTISHGKSLAVRLIHWTVALTILANLFYTEEGDPPHNWVGYVAVAAVLLRLLIIIRTRTHTVANNMARTVYLAIWTAVIILAVTGFMSGLDRFWGDQTLADIHTAAANTLKALIVLHFCGIIIDSIRFKRSTWMTMLRSKSN